MRFSKLDIAEALGIVESGADCLLSRSVPVAC